MNSQIVVVGSINIDLVIRLVRHPAPGETVFGQTLTLSPGGKGANQAVAAALLGAPTAMIGAVGDDVYAPVALRSFESAGVDVDDIVTVPRATGLARVEVDDSGENSIVVIPGANSVMDDDAVARVAHRIAAADIVMVQGEIPVSGIEEAITHATGRLILNLAPVVPLSPELLCRAGPLVVNEHEAQLALSTLSVAAAPVAAATEVADAGNDATAFTALARRLIEAGLGSVVLTLGARGCIVAQRTAADIEVVVVPAVRVQAVDTTGAGDAFTGALAAALARGGSLVDAARFAVRAAAYSVQRDGAQPSYPSRHDALPGGSAV